MDYKTSFAAIMSYALECNLISYPVAEVINKLKAEYKTEDLNLAVHLQLTHLIDVKTSVLTSDAKITKLINDAVFCILFD